MTVVPLRIAGYAPKLRRPWAYMGALEREQVLWNAPSMQM